MQENKIARASFKRLNIIPIISGLILIGLAFINIPFLIDEEGNFYFELLEQPGITFIIEMNIYIFMGIIPIIFGLIFIIFSLMTSRTITLNFLKKNDTSSLEIVYNKSPVFKNFLETNERLSLPDEVQQIIVGKRHQRFVTWAAFALIFFLVYLLTDYLNFLNLSYDIFFISGGIPISTRWMLTINILLLLIAAFLIVIFPRRFFQLDTPDDFIKFDYKSFQLERISEESKKIQILDVFELAQEEKGKSRKKEDPINIDKLKVSLGEVPNSHTPLFILIISDAFIILTILIQLIPDFFLLDFTADIKYFITFNSVYFFIRLHHSHWFTEQSVEEKGDSLIYVRKNPIAGTWANYNNFNVLNKEYNPYKPHYLEYFVVFFLLVEVIWVIYNLLYFPSYFLTNPYTLGYILTVIGIIVFIFLEYNTPFSMISMTPNFQSRNGKTEKFYLFFPINNVEILPRFKEAYKSKNIYEILRVNLILLIPIIFGVIWVILSALGVIPPLESTLF